MFNMIKMDIYRMFRTKSLYVIWIVMGLLIVATTYLGKVDLDMEESQVQQENEVQPEEQMAEDNPEDLVNLGITVEMPVGPGEKLTVFNMFYTNAQAKVTALFLVIFAVMFSTADINSGYIKNIGGQVRRRGNLIWSRTIALLIYTVLSMILFVLFQALSNRIFFGYLEWGDGKEFLLYLGVQIVLHFAMVIISMAIAVFLRNNVVSMIIVICLCMDLMVLLYSAVDSIIQRMGVKDFTLLKYTVTGKISLLSMTPGPKECMGALCIAAVFSVVLAAATSLIFEKRDI